MAKRKMNNKAYGPQPDDLQRLKAMDLSDKEAEEVHDLLRQNGLGFGGLLKLLPMLLKFIPKLKEIWQELQDSGILDLFQTTPPEPQ